MVRHVVRRCCKTFAVVGLTLAASFAIMPAVVATAATEEASATTQASSDYTYADGLAGFFRSIGDTTSASMVESLSGVKGGAAHAYYDNALDNIEDTTSALNLDSVKEAIDILEKCNELRRAAGLSELQVNTRLMALSAISNTYAANYGMVNNPHQVAVENNIGENLAWNNSAKGTSRAMQQWYDDEKVIFDEAVKDRYDGLVVAPKDAYTFYDSHESEIDNWVKQHYPGKSVGHYTNILRPDYTIMGAATADKLSGQRYYTYEQSFQSQRKNGQTMSVSEFKSKFNAYYNMVQEDREFTITVPTKVEHGELTINKLKAKPGEQIDITLFPDIGYVCDKLYGVTASGEKLDYNNFSVSFPFQRSSGCGFIMPASDVTIVATIKERMINVFIQQPEHGTISVDKSPIQEGDTLTITFKPDAGYGFSGYSVDFGPEMGRTGGTFDKAQTGGKTVTAKVEAEPLHMTIFGATYRLDESALPIALGPAEGLKATWPATAEPGKTVSVTLAAEDGYEVKGATARGADGKAVALTRKGDTWTFIMPDTPVSITPQVEKRTYGVTAAQAAGAKVTLGREDAQVGDTVSVTVQPEEGKRVSKVYIVDESGRETMATASGNRWSFKMPASSVSVRVELVGEDEALPVDFPDVHEGDWYYGPVVWAVESGAMSGYGNGSFGPLGTLTRGQVATILHNLAGKPAADGSAVGEDFSDCSPEDFYAEAVAWAVDEGIFSGYNNGTFGPSAPMSREQLCVVLWRMQGEPKGTADLSAFPDGSKTSTFAKDAVRWAVEEGLLQGNAQGSLNPTGSLNRAEGATILMRYSEMFG